MKYLKKLQYLFIAAMTVLVLGGCSSISDRLRHVTPSLTGVEFDELTEEGKAQHLKDVASEYVTNKERKEVYYNSERPVWYGEDEMSYTLLWDRNLNLIHMANGHKTGMFGINTAGTVTFEGDVDIVKGKEVPNGKIRKARDRFGELRPVVVLANVATQEAMGRLMVKGGFQMGSALLNSALAAKITSDGRCRDCGGIELSLTNVGGTANSLANTSSSADSLATIDIGTMPGGG